MQSRGHWIVEATHPEAAQRIFFDETEATDRLDFQRPLGFQLRRLRIISYPILENEGTVSGTYNVIEL